MGKKKDRKKREAKRAEDAAGATLPEELRRAGGALLAKANSPAGREMLAAGLGIAAAAANAAVKSERARREAGAGAPREKPGPPGEPHSTATDPHEIGVALGKMAEAVLGGLFAGKKG